jgi:hypothetical protein
MVELGTAESLCVVTGFTRRRGWNVLRGLDNVVSSQPKTIGMTGGAITRCALEDATDMATFTPGGRMHARKRETSLQVVKVIGRSLRQDGRGTQCKTQCHEALSCQAKQPPDENIHGAFPSCFVISRPPVKRR